MNDQPTTPAPQKLSRTQVARIERERVIVEVWNAGGLTMLEIAMRFESSRNAIGGLLHRARKRGIEVREVVLSRPPSRRSKRPVVEPETGTVEVSPVVGPAPEPLIVEPVEPVGTGHPTILTVRAHQCRWAVDRVREEWLFCGEPTRVGKSFCPAHHALAYTKRERTA